MRRITEVERKESLPLTRVIGQGEIWEWYCLARWPLEVLRGSQAPRRAVCGTRGSLPTMHGSGSASELDEPPR